MRGYRWLITLATIVLLAPVNALAQTSVVAGRVRDRSGTPVPGAFVSVPVLNLATAANDSGVFRLAVADRRSRPRELALRVWSLGYAAHDTILMLSAEVPVLEVTLIESALPLDELLVTGTAGVRARREQPVSLESIDAAAVTRLNGSANIVEILQGRVVGLSVTPSSGSAGSAQRILARGAASALLDLAPLVFIDGIRADSRIQINTANGGQGSSRLFDLNPEDIERIEVVKGPAAATLYGADASTGVIQIMTKRGRPGMGGFRHSLSVQYGLIDPNWSPPSNFARCSAAQIDPASPNVLCHGLSAGALIQDNPLLREEVLRNGSLRSINWSGQGGADNHGFFLSVGSEDENGTLPQNQFERRSARLNFQFLGGPALVFEAGLGAVRTVTQMPQSNDNPRGFLSGGLLGSPLTVGSVANGWLRPRVDADAIRAIEQTNTVLRWTPTLELRHTPRPWLTQRLTLGADVSHSSGHLFFPKNDRRSYGADSRGDLDNGWISEDQVQYETLTLDYLGSMRARFGSDGRFGSELTLGLQVIGIRNDVVTAIGAGLLTNNARSVSAALQRSGTQSSTQQHAGGILAQWQGSYRNRLFVQLGARADRNSRFGANADAFLLPRAGISWVVSDEPFWTEHFPFAGSLRLRAAWGSTGRAPEAGSALRTYSPSAHVLNNGQIAQGVYPASPGNPDLRAERGEEFEAGFDLGLGERIGLQLTYFNKNTRDMLLRRPAPPSEGFRTDPLANLGRVVNRGFEAALNAQAYRSKVLSWNLQGALNTLHNQLISLGGIPPFGQSVRYFDEGRPLGAIIVPRVRRIDAARGVAIVSDTAEFLGSTLPTLEGRLGTEITLLRNLRIAASIDWKTGHWLYDATAEARERSSGIAERRVRMDDLSIDERLRRFGPFVTEAGASVPASNVPEPYLSPADFLRWREMSLTYTVPGHLMRLFPAQSLSLTFAVRNLALWTKYSGTDPEVVTYVSDSGQGQYNIFDYTTMPQPRRFTLRLAAQF